MKKWRKVFLCQIIVKTSNNLFNCLKLRQNDVKDNCTQCKFGMKQKSLTIITSETELIDRIYIVTPTTTGSPEIDNIFKNISVKKKITLTATIDQTALD